jgi:hypothetical protein
MNDLFLFHLVNNPLMERKNKASLSRNLRFPHGKEEILRKPEGLGLAVSFLEYTFVSKIK